MDRRTPLPSWLADVPDARAGLSMPSLGQLLGTLYVSGGLTALAWTMLPRGPHQGDAVVRAMVAVAVVLGCVLVAKARVLVPAVLHAVLAFIQVVIGVAYVATGRPDSDLRLFFLWAAPYAALYFGRRAALAHVSWTALVAVVAALSMRHGPIGSGLLLLLATLTSGAVLVATAARALRSAEALQRHQASHDALTGLANRRALLDVLAARARSGSAVTDALVLLDLDGFKAVNDRYGHDRGDEVLQEVARRLTEHTRPDDLVCRLGGDEFALVVRDLLEGDDALAAAQHVVEAATVVVSAADGRTLTVRASAGVRLLGRDGAPPSTTLRQADVALYASKAAGGAQAQLWREGMRRPGEELDELSEDLRAALCGDQLRLVYQPVVDASTLRVRSVEVLARWSHPERGEVPPDVFVRCAERSGPAGELTRWVLRTAFAEAARWPLGLDGTAVDLAVNISAVQLADLQVVEDVREALAAHGMSAADVVLEVTETAEVVDLASAQRTLAALAALGTGLALDDFGTGFSSLTHVHALPFHILKIDRSFVAAAATGDRRAVATIAAVGALAARLGVDVVAEGVEDPAQLGLLRELGCGLAQGFGLSRPVPAEVVRAALAQRRPGGWVLPAAALEVAR